MASDVLTCPYCNASIGVQPGMAAEQRMVCPRCGDAFTLPRLDALTDRPDTPAPENAITAHPPAAGPSQRSETAITANPPTVVPPQRSSWLIAGAVVGVMLVMAGGGLAFMLMTKEQRRAYDTSRPPRRPGRQPGVPEPDIVPVAAVAPDKLAALGYLPSGANFLVAARIVELLDSPVGTQVLRDPIRFGESEYHLANLPAWVGLRLEDIDHLVFAAKLDDALIPPFYLVLRTTQPYDDETIRRRLNKGKRVASADKKKLYSFQAPKNDLTLHAWFADERTLVLSLFKDQLEALPTQPAEDLRQLPEEVRTVLKERREPVAPVWIVGHSRDWMKTTAGKFLGQMKKEDLQRLTAIKTFGLWLVPDKTLGVKGVFACKDAKAAKELGDYFRALRGPDPNFKTALDGPWLSLQYQTDPDFLSRLLKR